MNGDTGTGDFSGLSREQLLELVAAQQSQIRSQQQQQQQQQLQQQQLHHQQQLQQQQQQLAWLGQSQRLNAGGNFFPHQGLGGPGLGGQGLGGPALGGQGLGGQGLGAGAGSIANLGAFGGLGAADLSHYPAAANPAAGGGLADLLRQQRVTERKIPSATEMLQQAQAHAQDPLVRQLVLRKHLLGDSGAADLLPKRTSAIARRGSLGGGLGAAAAAAITADPSKGLTSRGSGLVATLAALSAAPKPKVNLGGNLGAAAAAISTAPKVSLTSRGGGLGAVAAAASISAAPTPKVKSLPAAGSSEDMLLRSLMAVSQPRATVTLLNATNKSSQRLLAATSQTKQQGSHAFTSEHLLAGSTRRLPGVKDPPAAEEGLDSSKPPGGKQAKKASAAAAKAAAAAKKKTKRPLSAYNIYFKEEHAKIIALKEREKAERDARGEPVVSSDDDYSVEEDEHGNKTGKRRKRQLSTNQPGKRGKRQVDFENLTKVIGKRWKELPKERIEEYKRRAEEAMQAYRKNLFQKIRNSVKEDQG